MSTTGISLANLDGASLGLGGGIDVPSTVNQLILGESGPLALMQAQLQNLQQENATISGLASLLSSFQKSVQNLTDATGPLKSFAVASTNQSVATATADSSAMPGTHTLVVQSLATRSSWFSAVQAGAAASDGSFQIAVGSGSAKAVNVVAGETLDQIASDINKLGIGVQANVLKDDNGSRLSLTSTSTGSASSISISSDSTGLGLTQSAVPAQDAQYTLDGVPLTSASNTITGVVQGLSLNLGTAAPGQTVTLSVQVDQQAVQNAVQGFVNAYNALITPINQQFAFNAATGSAGILSGDISLRQLQQGITGIMSAKDSSTLSSFRALGIEMQNDGTLQINQTTLTGAINTNIDGIRSMLMDPGNLGDKMNQLLMKDTDSINGPLAADAKGVQDQMNAVNQRMADFNDFLNQERQSLTTKYTAISVMLQQAPLQLAQIQSMLGLNQGDKK